MDYFSKPRCRKQNIFGSAFPQTVVQSVLPLKEHQGVHVMTWLPVVFFLKYVFFFFFRYSYLKWKKNWCRNTIILQMRGTTNMFEVFSTYCFCTFVHKISAHRQCEAFTCYKMMQIVLTCSGSGEVLSICWYTKFRCPW